MPCYRLRSYDYTPTGEYPFEQYKGIYKRFPAVPLIEAQAQAVSAFRKGNNLPRASLAESLQDVDRYQCRRLGNDPKWCIPCEGETVVALNTSSPMVSPPCRGCGAPVT